MTPYSPEALVGDLPDPPWATARTHVRTPRRRERAGPVQADPAAGVLRSARRDHRPGDRRPGALPGPDARRPDIPPARSAAEPERGWCCHGGPATRGGAIYDLASVLLGGPWGRQLRGEQFNNARAYVADVFGELT